MDTHRRTVEAPEDLRVRTSAVSLRVLLIDDHPPFRQTLAYLLRKAGHTVDEAGNGSAGLASLRMHPADLVITDRDMPGLSGWEVARLVKALEPRLPVLLVTGGVDARVEGRQDPPCVDAILWKPFAISDLLDLIVQFTGDRSTAAGPRRAA